MSLLPKLTLTLSGIMILTGSILSASNRLRCVSFATVLDELREFLLSTFDDQIEWTASTKEWVRGIEPKERLDLILKELIDRVP